MTKEEEEEGNSSRNRTLGFSCIYVIQAFLFLLLLFLFFNLRKKSERYRASAFEGSRECVAKKKYLQADSRPSLEIDV